MGQTIGVSFPASAAADIFLFTTNPHLMATEESFMNGKVARTQSSPFTSI
jgi:hypothetical protein